MHRLPWWARTRNGCCSADWSAAAGTRGAHCVCPPARRHDAGGSSLCGFRPGSRGRIRVPEVSRARSGERRVGHWRRGKREAPLRVLWLLPMSRTSGSRCVDWAAHRPAADFVLGVFVVRPRAKGSDAALHGQSRLRSGPRRHLRLSQDVSAACSGRSRQVATASAARKPLFMAR